MDIIDNLDELIVIDKRIDTAEDRSADAIRESLRDRWEFGRLMLAKRRRKQLPNGYLDKLVEVTGKSRQELGYRMQFAERYPTEDEVSTAVETFTSWNAVRHSLPKSPEPQGKKPRMPSVPTPHKKRDEMLDLAMQGLSTPAIAEKVGLSPAFVRHELEQESIKLAAEAEAAPVDWKTIPGGTQARLDRAKGTIRRELEKEFQTRLLAELDQHRAKLDADFAAHRAAYDKQNDAIKAMRDEERRRYNEGIEVYRAKGLITPDEYNVIRSCLHPDSRASVTDAKLAMAFRLFNDSRIKTLLVKEV